MGIHQKRNARESFKILLSVVYTDFTYGKTHRLMVDTYTMQHPNKYMISAKSYAAHLTGMGITMAHGDDPDLFRLTQQWLNGEKQLKKPELPEDYGDMTIAHVWEAKDGADHNRLVGEWAQVVWKAYVDYQELAEEWIEMARR